MAIVEGLGKMIICGDFAYPFDGYKKEVVLTGISPDFEFKPKIVNFESTLSLLNTRRRASGIALHSTQDCFLLMKDLNVVGVTLANNHVKDFEFDPYKFIDIFSSNDIQTVGFGNSLAEACKPILFDDKVILNFGWPVIGCQTVTEDNSGCNPLELDHVIDVLKQTILLFPDKKVIVVFHWNYEFELYPQPAHRKLAKRLIDIGASAVIGHHSHIIQGAELYKGKPIIYGLGNFYLPKHDYSGYYLDFPNDAYTGLAIDIDSLDSYLVCSIDNKLSVSEPIPLFENETVKLVSNFAGLSDSDYLLFFKTNRIKKKLLPIYNNWGLESKINDKIVLYRQVLIDTLVRFNLKKHKK